MQTVYSTFIFIQGLIGTKVQNTHESVRRAIASNVHQTNSKHRQTGFVQNQKQPQKCDVLRGLQQPNPSCQRRRQLGFRNNLHGEPMRRRVIVNFRADYDSLTGCLIRFFFILANNLRDHTGDTGMVENGQFHVDVQRRSLFVQDYQV